MTGLSDARPPAWTNTPRAAGPMAAAREIWAHRRFMGYLGWRALRRLYARTVFGWGWLFVRPLLPVVMSVAVFGGLVGLGDSGVPYFLFLTCGMLVWTLFASALMWSTRGLDMNREVLAHVYIPKVILPLATIMPALLNVVMTAAIFATAVAYYWVHDGTLYVSIGVHTVWALLALAGVLLLSVGLGFFTSVWGETARDARFVVSQVNAVWYLLTPVLYPASQVAPKYQGWLLLNPMAAFVESFKYGILEIGEPPSLSLLVACGIAVGVVVLGLMFFTRRTQDDLEI